MLHKHIQNHLYDLNKSLILQEPLLIRKIDRENRHDFFI